MLRYILILTLLASQAQAAQTTVGITIQFATAATVQVKDGKVSGIVPNGQQVQIDGDTVIFE